MARSEALQQLYKTKELDRERSESIEADFEEVAASCGHFSFSLLTFANEMQTYLSILDELKDELEKPTRSWKWLLFWRKGRGRYNSVVSSEQEALIGPDDIEAPAPKIRTEFNIRRTVSGGYGAPSSAAESRSGFSDTLLRLIRFLNRDDSNYPSFSPSEVFVANFGQ